MAVLRLQPISSTTVHPVKAVTKRPAHSIDPFSSLAPAFAVCELPGAADVVLGLEAAFTGPITPPWGPKVGSVVLPTFIAAA
jgi:hypothetical protein